MRIGVLRNPLSTRNLKNPPVELPHGAVLVEIGAEKSIAAAVRELLNQNLDLLIIDGGDGTITSAISALFAEGDVVLPMGFIANGNTNLIARQTESSLNREALNVLINMSPDELRLRLCKTPVLRFAVEGHEDRYGFIAGWGAYARGTRIAIEEMKARHDMQVMSAIFATFRRSIFGEEAKALRRGIECHFGVDEIDVASNSDRFVGVVTCLQGRLVAGVKPFWGKGDGVIRWLDVLSPARLRFLFAPFVLFGLPLPLFKRFGYCSGRASRVCVTLSSEMVIDGEIFPLSSSTRVDIDAERKLDILQM